MKKDDKPKSAVSSSEYTAEYYQSACDGYDEFNEYKGQVIPKRLQIPLELAEIKPGYRILDIGCGRGEILYHSIKAGALAYGFDYSAAAMKIASDNLKVMASEFVGRIGLHRSDAKQIPIKSNAIDIVFMLDVVEHLYPEELLRAYQEIWRVLREDGKLIIHTMPNLWYYRYIYPMFRFLQNSRGITLPKNPRDRWPFIHTHVNEQTPLSLYRGLNRCGFNTKVWLHSVQNYDDYSVNKFMRANMKLLTTIFPFRYFFCNDIFAVAIKTKE